MLKARTGTDRSLQSVMWASTATFEELFTENSVVSPFGSLRSTSKYGSSSVAAGATSTLQRAADAGTAEAATRNESAPRKTRHFISNLLQVCLQPDRREACVFNLYAPLRHGVARCAGAVEPQTLEADAEVAVGVHVVNHPGLGRGGIGRRVGVAGHRVVEIEENPAEVERHGEGHAVDLRSLRCRREGNDAQRRRRVGRRHEHLLLLVEDLDAFHTERVPGGMAAGHGAGEGTLARLRGAPDDEARAAGERAAIGKPGAEGRG